MKGKGSIVAARKKQKWGVGDLFTIELVDGSFGIGQVADVLVPHTASCAFFGRRFSERPHSALKLTREEVIAGVAVVEAHLDRGVWKVFSRCSVALPRVEWPKEEARGKSLVGLKIYTGAILEHFLNAYFGMLSWDTFHDPQYLDSILLDPSMKPRQVPPKSSAWRE